MPWNSRIIISSFLKVGPNSPTHTDPHQWCSARRRYAFPLILCVWNRICTTHSSYTNVSSHSLKITRMECDAYCLWRRTNTLFVLSKTARSLHMFSLLSILQGVVCAWTLLATATETTRVFGRDINNGRTINWFQYTKRARDSEIGWNNMYVAHSWEYKVSLYAQVLCAYVQDWPDSFHAFMYTVYITDVFTGLLGWVIIEVYIRF